MGWTWLERHDDAGRASDAGGGLLVPDASGVSLGREIVARGAPLVVGDAAQTGARAVAGALAAHGWRAFLAVPLLGATGAVFGALAVADVQPRAWREEDVVTLAELASIATVAAARAPDGRDAHADVDGRWLAMLAQHAARDARRKSEARLALAFHHTPDLTFLLSVDDDARTFRFVAVNEAYLALTGLPAEQVMGRSVAEVLPPGMLPAALERFRQALRDGEPLRYEEQLELPLGPALAEITLTPIADEVEHGRYLLGVARDVTGARRRV